MVRMSSYDDDPIIEIFDNDNSDDIQVINRDNSQYDQNLINSTGNTPHNYYNDIYDNSQPETTQQNRQHQPQEQLSSLSSILQLQPETHSNHQEPSGLTPILSSNDYNQLTTVNQPKYTTTLPPLAPLSESVIPNNLNIPPTLSLPKANDNQDKKPNAVTTSTKKRKEAPSSKTRPAFVMKIWSMVNDPANHDYIRWNDNGTTFQVFHREEFMKLILPKYFKHNNFASFVRQLNMYGWHKVQDISNGTLNKDDKSNDEIWQFENPYFIRGREDLLDKIVRNKSISQEPDHMEAGNLNFQSILNELDQIKVNQFAISEDLRRVRNDNKTLWQENFMTRERHQQQAQTLEKILKFLAAVYGNSAGKLLEVDNGSNGLDDFNSNSQMTTYNYLQPPQVHNQTTHPPIHVPSATDQTSQPPSPFNRPRLMLMDQAYQKSPSNNPSPKETTQRNSNSGSIEEIIRSYENTPNDSPNGNVNKIYQQLMHNEPGISSPRHYFPELNNQSNSYFGTANTPGQQYIKSGTPLDLSNNTSEVMNGLEQNIYKQGQSIQQVQDWIQKLAAQQQQQQQQQQQLQSLQSLHQNNNQNSDDYEKPDIDEFDVNEFLDNSNASNSQTSNSANSDLNDAPSNKRSIDEANDGNAKRKKR